MERADSVFQIVPGELLLNIIEQIPLWSVVSLSITSKSTVTQFSILLDNTFWKKMYEKRTIFDLSWLPLNFDITSIAKQKLISYASKCRCKDGCMDHCSCAINKICCDEECGCKCVQYESVADIPKNPAKNKHNNVKRDFRGNPYNVLRSISIKIPYDSDLTSCAKDNIPLFRNKRQLQKLIRRTLLYPCCLYKGQTLDFITTKSACCPKCSTVIKDFTYSLCYLSLCKYYYHRCCKRCVPGSSEDHDLICPDYFLVWSVNQAREYIDIEGLQKYREKMALFFETKDRPDMSHYPHYACLLLLGVGFVTANPAYSRTTSVDRAIMIGSLIFYGVLLLLSVTMFVLACLKRRKPKYDSETRPLIASPTPTPSDNISVSSEHKHHLLSEVKSDEVLAWAFEPSIQNRRAIDAFGAAMLAVIASFVLFVVFTQESGKWPFILSVGCFISWVTLFVGGCYRLFKTDVKLYGITNKRIFMIVITPKFRESSTVLVHDSDYEGLQQISMTRKEDGSGTLTFSLNLAGSYPIKSNPYANPYAFENISNVSQVKDIIESYKSAHQKV